MPSSGSSRLLAALARYRHDKVWGYTPGIRDPVTKEALGTIWLELQMVPETREALGP